MGISDICILIQIIQILATLKRQLFAIMNRLSAASYASARTRHDFYEIILRLATLNLVNQCSRITQPTDCCRPHCHIIYLEDSFLHTIMLVKSGASDCLECICRWILALQQIICRTKCRFHYAAGCSKDHACSSTFLHRAVAFLIHQCGRLDVCRTDHTQQLSGRYYRIHIVSRIFSVVQIHLPLALLCHARHHGYRIDLLRRYAKLLCKICLHYRAKHLLR